MYCREDATGVAIKHVFGFCVADTIDDIADYCLNVNIGFGFDLAGNDNLSCGYECLASDF